MKRRLVFGGNWIEVNVMRCGTTITSNLKKGCMEPPETCIGCAAVDGLESLILAHASAGIDITDAKYQEGIEAALDAIGNLD